MEIQQEHADKFPRGNKQIIESGGKFLLLLCEPQQEKKITQQRQEQSRGKSFRGHVRTPCGDVSSG